MDAYKKFKNEIDEILDDLDTLLFLLENRSAPAKTVRGQIELYEDTADRLKKTFEDLKASEGSTLIKDIDYEGHFRN